jgi:asparagine synthase (glutamine-hydrolysing)
MCGISGLIRPGAAGSDLTTPLMQMVEAQCHRGPDDSGVWSDAETGVGLGHDRLAIIDLSPTGHQPMASADGRYVITFNGEIYNYRELRERLAGLGHQFRGTSDTEVMLAAISQWGIRDGTERFNGMFAFAVWDRQERQLHLARDRFGEKPLYYGWMGTTFAFASELKAFRGLKGFDARLDRGALALFLRHSYIPAPYSIYASIAKLPPGTIGTVTPDRPGRSPEIRSYWSARDSMTAAIRDPFSGGPSAAIDTLEGLLKDSVSLRMLSDVPLGAFLSGGIDSSLVVSLMQHIGSEPVRTFSIGFEESRFDEAPFAKAVAEHLGTDHTELYVRSTDALDVIPSLPDIYDEPFADSSQIPTYLVASMARRDVTVALSGDAGDELFGGYRHYQYALRMWGAVGRTPSFARSAAAAALRSVPDQVVGLGARVIGPLLPARMRAPADLLARVRWLAGILPADTPEALFRAIVSQTQEARSMSLAGVEPLTVLSDRSRWLDIGRPLDRFMYCDTTMYLPDDILVKVDRAAMAVSLETRIPMLDHRVAEFAWRLPEEMRLQNGSGKWILRQLLGRYLPNELIDRPKRGFSVPVAEWLRGPLRGWADGLLDEDRLRSEGILDVALVRDAWSEHLAKTSDHERLVWNVLMFQAWAERAPVKI